LKYKKMIHVGSRASWRRIWHYWKKAMVQDHGKTDIIKFMKFS